MMDTYEVYALRYAERAGRTRADSFLFDATPTYPHAIDYFLWVLRNDTRTIVIDTGYDADEARRRGRPILQDPLTCLREFGVEPDTVETVILTHLHYDHAGALHRFPAATFHLQLAEMAYATGPCMCHGALNHPYTGSHVCALVQKVYSGRVVFHDGDGPVAPGIEVLGIGGHSRGLQAVRVATARGPMILASDAAHYYENYLKGKLFPIVVDPEAMLDGFARLARLAPPDRVVPGHDPIICEAWPRIMGTAAGAAVYRLDVAPSSVLDDLLGGTGS